MKRENKQAFNACQLTGANRSARRNDYKSRGLYIKGRISRIYIAPKRRYQQCVAPELLCSISSFVKIYAYHMMRHCRKKSITAQNHEEFRILFAQPDVKMQKIKRSKEQTHNFDACFLETSKTGD